MSKGRIVLLIFLLLLVVGGIVAYRMWNKKHPEVADQKSMAVPAAQLYADFSTKEDSANAKYLDQVIEVSGQVSRVTANQDGMPVLLLAAGAPTSAIQCTMKEKAGYSAGQEMHLKGFCKAYMSPMMEGDTGTVVLSECIPVK